MSGPAIIEYAALMRRAHTEPEIVRTFDAAIGWARRTLGRAADDDLSDLEGDHAAALYGYASDLLKLPKATFGMFGPEDIDGLQVVAGDIGRRWSGQLTFGLRTKQTFA